MSKETCFYGKKSLLKKLQPFIGFYGKRDRFLWQKNPTDLLTYYRSWARHGAPTDAPPMR
jgi:hypothetical protein